MTVAVITIVAGRAGHLHRQRVGLAAADPRPDRHVVVGMGLAPALSAVPGAPPVQCRIVPAPAGLPLAAARNLGAAAALAAGAELLVFLDVDCIPGPTLLGRYAAAAVRFPGPALLCGPVTYLPPPGPGGYPSTDLHTLAAPHPARPVPADGELIEHGDPTLFWSLSFAVTAATWARTGGFCPDYTGYGAEDTDFAVVAAAAGVPMVWVGGAHAFHQHHPPSRDGAVADVVANAVLFHRRHGWWPMRGWLDGFAADGRVEFDPDRGVLRVRAPF